MSTEDELACRELVEIVTAYLEDALPADERARVEEHLADCDGCRNYLDQMRHTIAVTGTLRERDLDPQAEAVLLAAFRGFRRDSSKERLP
jgi:anti-sigma factor RsiW